MMTPTQFSFGHYGKTVEATDLSLGSFSYYHRCNIIWMLQGNQKGSSWNLSLKFLFSYGLTLLYFSEKLCFVWHVKNISAEILIINQNQDICLFCVCVCVCGWVCVDNHRQRRTHTWNFTGDCRPAGNCSQSLVCGECEWWKWWKNAF